MLQGKKLTPAVALAVAALVSMLPASSMRTVSAQVAEPKTSAWTATVAGRTFSCTSRDVRTGHRTLVRTIMATSDDTVLSGAVLQALDEELDGTLVPKSELFMGHVLPPKGPERVDDGYTAARACLAALKARDKAPGEPPLAAASADRGPPAHK
jgi:hypothetical protein